MQMVPVRDENSSESIHLYIFYLANVPSPGSPAGTLGLSLQHLQDEGPQPEGSKRLKGRNGPGAERAGPELGHGRRSEVAWERQKVSRAESAGLASSLSNCFGRHRADTHTASLQICLPSYRKPTLAALPFGDEKLKLRGGLSNLSKATVCLDWEHLLSASRAESQASAILVPKFPPATKHLSIRPL